MKPGRSEATRALLCSRLQDESARCGFGSFERIEWIVVHLEEYVARLNGALAIPGWTMKDLVGSDTLVVIEIAGEILDEEIRAASVPEQLTDVWRSFSDRLMDVQRSAVRMRGRTVLGFFSGMVRKREISDIEMARKLWESAKELVVAVKSSKCSVQERSG